ncbi:unnamed protein product [Chironomus riparius]|uniref:Endonuclease/exonuclease/phosphatase domain-containing protein n=1 Tax=Chironomus riparius TaxID=315576 RepID=A0A9N9RZH6_9DIPT|nr:unnamed protein product [Chironomus riparius]
MAHASENLKNIKIYYQNVEGLRTAHKQEQLKKSLKNCESINLIVFVETNFDKEIDTAEIFDKDFIVIRRDRQERAVRGHGGGLLVAYPKSSIIKSVKICDDISSCVDDKTQVEDLWLTINLTNGENLHLCIVYLRPQCKKEYFEQFFMKLKANFESRKSERFLIVGDFNFDDYRKLKQKVIVSKRKGSKLDVMDKCTQGLKQINRIHNKDDKVLDMIFTNIKGSVELSTYQLVKAQDKHPPLLVNLNLQKVEAKIDKNTRLEDELKSLKESFEKLKISHDEDIKELRNEIRILRGILDDEGIL